MLHQLRDRAELAESASGSDSNLVRTTSLSAALGREHAASLGRWCPELGADRYHERREETADARHPGPRACLRDYRARARGGVRRGVRAHLRVLIIFSSISSMDWEFFQRLISSAAYTFIPVLLAGLATGGAWGVLSNRRKFNRRLLIEYTTDDIVFHDVPSPPRNTRRKK